MFILIFKIGMKQLLFLVVGFGGVFGVIACKKQTVDKQSPVLLMVSPLANMEQSFTTDADIHLEFTLSDQHAIETLLVSLHDSAGKAYYNTSINPNVPLFPFHVHCTMTQPVTAMPMRCAIKAIDVAGNTTDTLISFTFKP